MNFRAFDAVARGLTRTPSRRDILRSLSSTGIGLGIARWSELAEARKKRKRKRKKKKSPPPCTPSCAGRVCGDDGCGGICGDSCPPGERCVQGRCVCLAGTERCGVRCVPPCSIAEVRNPETCGCCQPNGTPFCTPGATTRCCSGECLDVMTDLCVGKSPGEPCRFDAQCHSNTCDNDRCAA
jgi:hypothetical protein